MPFLGLPQEVALALIKAEQLETIMVRPVHTVAAVEDQLAKDVMAPANARLVASLPISITAMVRVVVATAMVMV